MSRALDPVVYLMASRPNGTLYVGVTSNLIQRIAQHRDGLLDGFTSTHDVKMLVWFEQHGPMESAIKREKQIKKWRRACKIELIQRSNPGRTILPANWDSSRSATGFPLSRE